jgi:hypothetical protein
MEPIVAQFEALSQHLFGHPEENHEKYQAAPANI